MWFFCQVCLNVSRKVNTLERGHLLIKLHVNIILKILLYVSLPGMSKVESTLLLPHLLHASYMYFFILIILFESISQPNNEQSTSQSNSENLRVLPCLSNLYITCSTESNYRNTENEYSTEENMHGKPLSELFCSRNIPICWKNYKLTF